MVLRKLAALAAVSVAVLATPVAPAQADPYTPQIPTVTHIEVVSAEPGEPVVLEVSASANYPTPPEGDIAVSLSAASGAARGARAVVAAPLFSTTVHFVDQPVRVEGPVVPRGRYTASAALTPADGALFLPSDATTAFRIGADGETGGEDDSDNGGLPDTGGPDLIWLLLGTALVGAGAAGVGFGRRRQVAVPA